MSLYNVWQQFIGFFIEGTTIAPEVVQFFCLALTIATVWFLLIRPVIKILRR